MAAGCRCARRWRRVRTGVTIPARPGRSPSTGDQPPLRVGYYVHHHGLGHLTRYRAIRRAASFPIDALSELADAVDGETGCLLTTDVPDVHRNGGGGGDPTAGGTLHWAPIAPSIGTARLGRFVGWLHETQPAGVVVDVSVEAALTCRLAGVPTVVVRQHGDRTDSAHELSYRQAARLLAPWPRALEHPDTPDWVVAKTVHVGFIGGSDPAHPASSTPDVAPGPNDVVVLWGTGGGHLGHETVRGIAAAVPDAKVFLAGKGFADSSDLGNVVALGWVEDIDYLLAGRPVVIASAGNNTVAAAARFGCPLVVVPQPRPFDEQVEHARRLDASGAAVAVLADLSTGSWSSALGAARDRAHRLAVLFEPGGAARAADMIGREFGVTRP